MPKPATCLYCGGPWDTEKQGKRGFALVCYKKKTPRPHKVTIFWMEGPEPALAPAAPTPEQVRQAERRYLAEITELLDRVNRLGERGTEE